MTARVPSSSRIMTIASGKGGVGKTWAATTLCHILAGQGKRVLLFDGDLGLANVDIQLGLIPDVDLGQVLAGAISLEQAVIPFNGGAGRGGFDIISGQSGSGSLAALNRERLIQLNQDIQQLSTAYDLTLVDLGAGVETAVMTLCQTADRIVTVVTADPTSLTDAYAFIKMSRLQTTAAGLAHRPLGILVNMVSDRHEGRRVFDSLKKACETFLKFTPDYMGAIRHDKHVTDAIRHQKPLLMRHPQTPAGEDMAEIAKKM